MTRLRLAQGWIRAKCGLCPACNSDAPECDDCPVCQDWYGCHRPDYPAPKEIQAQWWQRFVNPEPGGIGEATSRESWIKRSWRFILRAYYQHHETEDPARVLLIPAKTFPADATAREVQTLPVYAADAIYTRVVISLSFFDLLRCLLGCKLRVNSVTYCQNSPGATKCETIAFATFD